MSFSDVFKNGFLENITGVTIPEMAIALLLALGVLDPYLMLVFEG